MQVKSNRKINNLGAFTILVLLCLLVLTGQSHGQYRIDLSNPIIRADYVNQLAQQNRLDKEQAWQIALEQGWAPREEIDGVTYELMAIRDGQLFVNTTHNVNAAITTATNLVRNAAPYNVNGAGETIGVWDAGGIRTTHQEFGARVSIMDGSAYHYHSTHVGGTIGAGGVVANAQGMAPNVNIDSYNWDNDEAEIASRAMSYAGEPDTIQVSNNSFGYSSGWVDNYNPIRWYGTWGNPESENFGIYSTYSRGYDDIIYQAPYFLIFKSAGNDRNDSAPAIGTTFAYYSGGWTTKSYAAGDPPDDYHKGGYDTIPHRGNSKNLVTVGAVEDAVLSGARYLPYADMTSFSGWGPTDDGRIKPDIVGNGANLYSTDKDSDSDYRTLPGTSMSTPNVSGSAILLIDHYKNLFPGQYMRASTIKALILHTADDLGNPGPDYKFGWGLMNTEAAADVITEHYNNPGSNIIVDDALSTTDTTDTFSVYSDGATPLRVTICWTDPPGTATAALNSTALKLVNDLDLRIIGPGGSPTYYPYVLNPSFPANNAYTGDNYRDNVEQVYLATPAAGDYTIQITYSGSITNTTQRYSMITSGASEALPEIHVTPTYFNRSLFAYQSLTEQFTISNTGSGILEYNLGTLTENGKVLWDLTHGVLGGYQPSSSYSDLADELQAKGYTIDTTSDISSADLDQYDVLVICLGSAWTSAYTTAEVNAIESFVHDGGGLLIMGDNPNTPVENINPVAQAFGTTCGVSSTDSIITNMDVHPILGGVSELTLNSGGELTASPSYEQAWDSSNKALVTARTYYSGRVVVVGDINAWVNGTSLSSSDNLAFMKNTFDWLNKCDWLTTYTTSGTITGGDNRVVSIYFNTWGIEPGSYHCQVIVANNDSNENPTVVNVYLTVMPQPNINVDTPSIQVELIPDTQWSHTVNIANNGDADLEYVIADTETTGHPIFKRVWQDPNPLVTGGFGQLKAEVYDPEGLADMEHVRWWVTRKPSDGAFFYDDGVSGGDTVAGDGIYSSNIYGYTGYGLDYGILCEAMDSQGNTGMASLPFYLESPSSISSEDDLPVCQQAAVDDIPMTVPTDIGAGPEEISGVTDAGLDPESFTVGAKESYFADSGPTIVAVAASDYSYNGIPNDDETVAIHQTLTSLGFSYVDVTTVAEAQAAGAEVIIVYPGGYHINLADLNDYLSAGGGLIQIGDWTDWFPNSFQNVTEGNAVTVNLYNTTHPITQGLANSWTTRGFFAYGYTGFDYVGWTTDDTLTNIASVQGDGCDVHYRGISVDLMGFGRAVYFGFNVFGSLAGPNETLLLENALYWVAQPDCTWLNESPSSDTVPISSNCNNYITIDTTGLIPGDYSAEIGIASNDHDENPTMIPVQLTVSPVPDIHVQPPVIDITLPPDTTWNHNLRVNNYGFNGVNLDYTVRDLETTGGPYFEWVRQDPNPTEEGICGKLLAKVNDPDGLADITSVRVWFAENPSYSALLLDTGAGYDEVAGDGIYSYVTPPDSYVMGEQDGLIFQATDTAGNIGRASMEYNISSTSAASADFEADSPDTTWSTQVETPPSEPDQPPSGAFDDETFYFGAESYQAASSSILVAVGPANATERTEIHNTLTALGYSWIDVADVTEATVANANVIVTLPGESLTVTDLNNYISAGGGLIQIGDWTSWFDNDFEAIGENTPATITIEDAYHPLTHNLPDSWTGFGFWKYGYGDDFVAWAEDEAMPSIAAVQADGFDQHPRALSATNFGLGRAVFIGFNVYGSLAGANDLQVLENALDWAGNAIDWTGGAPWLTENPTTGSINAYDYDDINIDIDTTGLTLGQYTAEIYLYSNDPDENPTIVPVLLTIAPPKFTGRVLFDETHATVGGFSVASLYDDWANLLRSWGFQVDRATAIPTTYAALVEPYCTVVIPPSKTLYTSAEINALRNFVDQGKGLLIMGEYGAYAQGQGVFPVANGLAAPFGMSFNDDEVFDDTNNDGRNYWPILPYFDNSIVGADVIEAVEYAGASVGAVAGAFPIAWTYESAYTDAMTVSGQQQLFSGGTGLGINEPTNPDQITDTLINLLSEEPLAEVPPDSGVILGEPAEGPAYIQSDIQYIDGLNETQTVEDGRNYGSKWFAIQYAPAFEYNLKKIELIAGEGTGTVTVQLRPDDDGVPSATVLRETTYEQVSAISWQAAEFDLAYRLEAGNTYWIVYIPINGTQTSTATSGNVITHAHGADGVNWTTNTSLYWMVKFYEDVRIPVMAASYYGNGRAAVIGDGDIFSKNDWDGDDYRSLFERDNEKLAVNIIEWLCEPQGIEVDKLVWDKNTSSWENAIYVSLDEVVRFQCTITNVGHKDLDSIRATDLVPPMLQYYDNATVNGVMIEPTMVSPNEYLWDFSSFTLAPGESIVIEFDALVIDLGKQSNTIVVEAEIAETGRPVAYDDTATVQTIRDPDLIITKIICDRDNDRMGYIVKNVGGDTAYATHTAGLWINSSLEAKDDVEIDLDPGDTFEGYFDKYEWPFCNSLDELMVAADIGDEVPEYDETNNQKVGGCISAVLEWTWNSTLVEPNYIQVMMAPVAADLNGDHIAEIIFSTFAAGAGWTNGGILRAISGDTGAEVFSVTHPKFRVQAGAEPAVADIDNDGLPEIVVSKQTGELICFEHDGTYKWTGSVVVGRLGVAIADLDRDGVPEIIASNRVFNNDGSLRWTGAGSGSYVSAVADLDLDGRPEVVTGGSAFHCDGSLYWSSSPAGRCAVGNFDRDVNPEIAVVSSNTVTLKEHNGAVIWGPVNIPGRGYGPPVVADFDGDRELEIGVGGHDYYVCYEADGSIKWTVKIQDHSSRAASSTAFDFNGDGAFEICYSDERYHRILRGSDGAILFEVPGRSGTLMEQPIVVDCDSDGRAEMVFAVNNYGSASYNTGIEVYGNDVCWPNARNIWNQHTYHITNIHDDATVPAKEVNNWAAYNNFRTQSSPKCNRCGDFNSDLTVQLFDLHVFTTNWLWEASLIDPFNEADLNCDGIVNLRDFAVFGSQWMGVCPLH